MQLYLLAPVVLCSPIPLVLAGDLQAVLAAAHPPAPVAASRPEHALPEVVPVQSGDAGAKETSIDNRPLTPSATAQPSAVLASHRPIVTEYLLSLTHRPRPWRKIGSPAVVKLPADAVGAVGSSSVAPMKMSIAAEEVEVLVRMGAPCYHIRLGPGNNDVLVVILIVVFLALVVVVEMFRRLVLSVLLLLPRFQGCSLTMS